MRLDGVDLDLLARIRVRHAVAKPLDLDIVIEVHVRILLGGEE